MTQLVREIVGCGVRLCRRLPSFFVRAIEPSGAPDVALPLAPYGRRFYVQEAAIGGVQFSACADSGDARSLSKGVRGAPGRGRGPRRDRGCRAENSGTREGRSLRIIALTRHADPSSSTGQFGTDALTTGWQVWIYSTGIGLKRPRSTRM